MARFQHFDISSFSADNPVSSPSSYLHSTVLVPLNWCLNRGDFVEISTLFSVMVYLIVNLIGYRITLKTNICTNL